MENVLYFDYKAAAREHNVPLRTLRNFERQAMEEFPGDRMMFELHLLRAVKSGLWRGNLPESQTHYDSGGFEHSAQ
jgi:hypothetical protein